MKIKHPEIKKKPRLAAVCSESRKDKSEKVLIRI